MGLFFCPNSLDCWLRKFYNLEGGACYANWHKDFKFCPCNNSINQRRTSSGKADVFEFDLVLGVQTEEVGPGDYIECSPVVTNIGNIPGNVYLKIIQPMVQEEGTPLYVFEINDKWMKKEELVLGDEVVITYMYSEPLKRKRNLTPA